EGKKIYTLVCVKLAVEAYNKKDYSNAIMYSEKAKQWPRNLGVGKPYEVDERLEDYIIAKANNNLGGNENLQKLKNDLLKDIRNNSKTLNTELALEAIKTLN
ncbi:MAG: hypothetical protein JKY02_09725, partial [Flavobacteriaceae bacterium]|nr:hypothetical protein [Flavobacteriaceae bacterium]